MKIFKKIKEQIKNYFAYNSEKEYDAYQWKIDTAAKELETNEILNFTSKGFDYIFENLVLQTSYDLVIFVKNYESMFDEHKLNLLKLIASKFDRVGDNKIRIYTYSGELSKQFSDLEINYKSVFYTPLNFIDDIDANNFIVSDKVSYWLEEHESAKTRNLLSDKIKLKAKVNFKDASKSKELINYVNGIDRFIHSKIKANSLKMEE